MEELKGGEVVPPTETNEKLIFDMDFVARLNNMSKKLDELSEGNPSPFICFTGKTDRDFKTFKTTLKTLVKNLCECYQKKNIKEALSDSQSALILAN